MKAERDHDRRLDAALTQALTSGVFPPASDACLDAETLAAWMDDGLESTAVARAERHVSSCARCQALVGAMARVTPSETTRPTAFSASWRWWMAPLAAGAAAATLWMVVPTDRYIAPPVGSVAESVAELKADVGADAPPQPLAPTAPPPLPQTASRDTAVGRAAPARAEPSLAGSAESADARRERAADAQVQMAPSPPAARGQAAVPFVEVVSPDPDVRWRISADGAVEGTTDGGAAWELVAGTEGRVLAGAAPSRDVCWLVGRDGLVLLAFDGRPLTRLAFPEQGDVVAVEATDARTAVVTLIDGRTFATADGGTSWRQRN